MKKLLSIIVLIYLGVLSLNAQFSPPINLSTSFDQKAQPHSIDIDNDGDEDIVVLDANKVVWFENLGNGVFDSYSRENLIENISYGNSISFFDMDLDGHIDIVWSSQIEVAWHKNLGGGTFSEKKIITTSNSNFFPSKVITNDFNSDGFPDVIVSSKFPSNNPELIWFENIGGLSIDTTKHIISNIRTNFFNIADINNDGLKDVLSAPLNSNGIYWHINMGNGVFVDSVIAYPNLSAINKVMTLIDVDNDGNLDVVHNINGFKWVKNFGNGLFDTISNYVDTTFNFSAFTFEDVIAKDVDNDGYEDLFFADGSKVFFIKNLGGYFAPTQAISNSAGFNAWGVSTGDVNGDGNIDILPSKLHGNTENDKIIWYNNLGNGIIDSTFNVIASNITNFANQIKSSDMDNDGDVDIVLTASDGLVWYENLGNGNFSPLKFISNGRIDLELEDIDGDGFTDIVTSVSGHDKIDFYKNLGGGQFAPPTSVNIPNSPPPGNILGLKLIELGDINNDSELDILFCSSHSTSSKIGWYENLGGGAFDSTDQNIIFQELSYVVINAIRLKDMDNDGDLDIITDIKGTINKLCWFENLGNGLFGNRQNIATYSQQGSDLFTIDIDGDGDNDIVFCEANKVVWHENLGSGNFGAGQVISTSITNPLPIFCIDFDNDGDNDVIVNSTTDSVIVWFENFGNGNFSTHKTIATSLKYPSSLYVDDINNDGVLEILSVYRQQHGIIIKNYSQSPYKLKGKVYYDANQNSILDSNELGLPFIQTQLQPSSMGFTTYDGNYIYAVDTGVYTVNHLPVNHWNLSSDSASYTREITSQNVFEDSLDFGFYPDSIVTIIQPDITGGFPRCNAIVNYWLNIQNLGTTIPSGYLQLTLGSSITYVSSDIAPDSISGQNIYWSYDSLFFYTNKKINLQVQMPNFTQMGNMITSYLSVYELDNNNIVYSNSDSLKQILVCAYDPNDKTVTPKGEGWQGYVLNNQELEYLIRFQNTGNDTAVNIMIADQLDTNLDWNSLQIISSSHSDKLQILVTPNGEISFRFNNIMLPDSTADFLGSQGYVKFRINMNPNLLPNTKIKNKAHIYFDANPAIITNNVLNTIYDCSNINLQLSSTSICQNEKLIGYSYESEFSDAYWEIDSIYSSNNDSLIWNADTVGTFDLKLTINNSLCNKDTLISITVNPSASSSSTIEICQNDSIFLEGNYQNTPGTYYDTLQTILGCDSVIATTLTVKPAFVVQQNSSICQNDSIFLGGSYQNISGTYYDSLQTILGCDSVIATTLTVNPTFVTQQSLSICQNDSVFLNGSYQNTSGTYYDSLQTILGCDSVIETILAVNSLPLVNLNSFNPDTLCSNSNPVSLPIGTPSGGIYSGNGISGNDFDPSSVSIGTHNIIYTFTDSNSCINSDTTSIYVVLCTSIEDINVIPNIKIYPNPNTGKFIVEKINEFNQSINVKLLDGNSKIIIDKTILNNQDIIDFDITNYSKGLYYLHIIIDNNTFVKKILKN